MGPWCGTLGGTSSPPVSGSSRWSLPSPSSGDSRGDRQLETEPVQMSGPMLSVRDLEVTYHGHGGDVPAVRGELRLEKEIPSVSLGNPVAASPPWPMRCSGPPPAGTGR